MPRKIDAAAQERAVRRVLEHRADDSSLTAAAAAVARQERLGAESVRRWVVHAEVDAGEWAGTTSTESDQVRKLRAENAQLREDVAISWAATTYRTLADVEYATAGSVDWYNHARPHPSPNMATRSSTNVLTTPPSTPSAAPDEDG